MHIDKKAQQKAFTPHLWWCICEMVVFKRTHFLFIMLTFHRWMSCMATVVQRLLQTPWANTCHLKYPSCIDQCAWLIVSIPYNLQTPHVTPPISAPQGLLSQSLWSISRGCYSPFSIPPWKLDMASARSRYKLNGPVAILRMQSF